MQPETLKWFDVLSRALLYIAGIVAVLAIMGALAIATSSSAVPVIGDIQRESRGILTIGALGGGFTAAGLLAGLGALLRLQLADRLERLDPTAPGPSEPGPRSKRSRKRNRGAVVDAEADYSDELEQPDEDPVQRR